ncbi:MAG: dihydropteroate synthase [Stellaceae bacterium]
MTAPPDPLEKRSPASARGFAAFAPAGPLRLCPAGLLEGDAAAAALAQKSALPLAGGPRAFSAVEARARGGGGPVSAFGTLDALQRWAEAAGRRQEIAAWLAALTAPRAAWAGLTLERPRLMGVLNVTPDSFSDGGDFIDPARAVAQGRALAEAGADIVDVGGESTRPRAEPISPAEEIRRIAPVVEALAASGIAVSIDTRHAAVMRAALQAGARVINDVTALTGDRESLALAAESGAAIVLMHMAGDPRTMQDDPRYDDVTLDVLDFLESRIAACAAAGIARARIAVDPGIGFGKKDPHNLALLGRLALFHGTACAVALGASRKSFIARLGGGGAPKQRLGGSLAAALSAAGQGVQILRVHDVAETRQALAIRAAVAAGVEPGL